VINGEEVTVAEFEAELSRLAAAQVNLGTTTTPEDQKQVVLDDLVDQTLLAQGAAEGGFTMDEAALQARIDRLASQLGGSDALFKWQADHGYDEESFRLALRRSAAAAWQRDILYEAVPETAEQVHVRQILVYNKEDAERALSRLVPGADFATLAYRYDPVAGGDLGWFPRGYLTAPEVEASAFTLQPGEVSPIIESRSGFHIIQVIERDPHRQLNPDARLALQKQAVRDWLKLRKEQSQIILTLP